MNNKPWQPEKEVELDLVMQLINEQCPDAHLVSIEYLAKGFESTVFLVNKQYIFKFPRRTVSVGFLEQEIRILPILKQYVSVNMPEPLYIGHPSKLFSWPFAGFSFVPGHGADFFALNRQERVDLAKPVAYFLKQLHAVPLTVGQMLELGPDPIERLNFVVQHPQALQLLERVEKLHIFNQCTVLRKILESLHNIKLENDNVIVHGDLYARHLLLDNYKNLSGVIDWGEAHIGNRAIDLAMLFSFFPKEGFSRFQAVYGDIKKDVLQAALFRAIKHTLHCVLYAHDVKDKIFLDEALYGLSLIVEYESLML